MNNPVVEARKALGMTQEELEEKSGVSRSTISKIENNIEAVVKTKTLIAIAEALNTNVKDLFFKHVV